MQVKKGTFANQFPIFMNSKNLKIQICVKFQQMHLPDLKKQTK